MAVTLSGKAGSTLRAGIRYWQPGKTVLTDTTGYTARLQLRATQRPGRVLLNTHEYVGTSPAPAGTILTRQQPGEWTITLNRAATRALPSSVRFEVELVNDNDPDDVTAICDGIINLNPEGVANA